MEIKAFERVNNALACPAFSAAARSVLAHAIGNQILNKSRPRCRASTSII
jgi:hypothetical protein